MRRWGARVRHDSVGSIQDDPARTNELSCDEQREVEVTGLVALPAELDSRVTAYADLLEQDSELYAQIRESVVGDCNSLNAVFDLTAQSSDST